MFIQGTTDNYGNLPFSWTIDKGDPIGGYIVLVKASATGYMDGTAFAKFRLEQYRPIDHSQKPYLLYSFIGRFSRYLSQFTSLINRYFPKIDAIAHIGISITLSGIFIPFVMNIPLLDYDVSTDINKHPNSKYQLQIWELQPPRISLSQ